MAPQLCASVESPPNSDGWCHEIKFDGYRMQLRVEDGDAVLKTRKALDWTDKFGESNRLTYIVRYEDLADRERKWNAFLGDEEWNKARAASEAPENGGPIVANVINTIMVPTDYSELK